MNKPGLANVPGAFLLRGAGGMVDPRQQELLDEMLSFPLGKRDYLLASAARSTAATFLKLVDDMVVLTLSE